MTQSEAADFLRVSRLCRWAALPLAVLSIPAVFFVWQDAGRAWGLALTLLLVAGIVDLVWYVPRLFARIVRERGIVDDSKS